jgi:trehalose 6-phosphate phosphatase
VSGDLRQSLRGEDPSGDGADLGAVSLSPWTAIDAALGRLAAARPPVLVVVDFDGTLAPGSRDPSAAAIDPVARRALRRLAAREARDSGRVRTVVLTGRTVVDVAARVRVGGIDYLGDHGLQVGRMPRGGRVSAIRARPNPGFAHHQRFAERFATDVPDVLGHPAWLFVERKGPSVAFHVRQADDVAAARSAVQAAIAAVEARGGTTDHGLAHYRGRSVIDLRPVAAGGKREAVERLAAETAAGALVAIGDEVSDVDAFEAVLACRSAPGGPVGVTVAVHGVRPAPADLSEIADLQVGSSRAVGRFLSGLADRLERE